MNSKRVISAYSWQGKVTFLMNVVGSKPVDYFTIEQSLQLHLKLIKALGFAMGCYYKHYIYFFFKIILFECWFKAHPINHNPLPLLLSNLYNLLGETLNKFTGGNTEQAIVMDNVLRNLIQSINWVPFCRLSRNLAMSLWIVHHCFY